MVGKVSCVSPERLRMKYVAEEGKIVEEEKKIVSFLKMKCTHLSYFAENQYADIYPTAHDGSQQQQ